MGHIDPYVFDYIYVGEFYAQKAVYCSEHHIQEIIGLKSKKLIARSIGLYLKQ